MVVWARKWTLAHSHNRYYTILHVACSFVIVRLNNTHTHAHIGHNQFHTKHPFSHVYSRYSLSHTHKGRVRERKRETYIIYGYIGYSIMLSHIEWNRIDVCKFVSLKIVYWFDSFIHWFIHWFMQPVSVCDPLSVRGQAFSSISKHTHWHALFLPHW